MSTRVVSKTSRNRNICPICSCETLIINILPDEIHTFECSNFCSEEQIYHAECMRQEKPIKWQPSIFASPAQVTTEGGAQ